jgi:hypothetical protein
VVAAKIVTTWFYDREIGLAMGIFNISMPLGTILSLNFMGAIAFRFNWQASIWYHEHGRWYWDIGRPLYRRQFKGCDGRLPVEFRRHGHFSRLGHNTHVDT